MMTVSADMKRYARLVLVALALLVLLPQIASALEIPPVPTDIPIVDQTGTLTPEQKMQLASVIDAERKNSGNQISVLMIASLEDEALEEYSLNVARTWGIGGKERNNGVLLLVVKDDRRVRIEVGYGLEGALTDIRSGQIIRDRMAPEFRAGRYYEGVQSGVQGIITAVQNEKDPALTTEPERRGPSIPWEAVLFGIFILPSWLGAMLARTKSWWAGGVLGGVIGLIIAFFVGFMMLGLISIIGLTLVGLLFDRAVSSNYQRRVSRGLAPSWWAGGTHIGGGGSGGFGGFGGGSFGGGGASGDW